MPYFITVLPYLVVILFAMKKAIILIYLIFIASFVYAYEETPCEKKWNDHYDNLPDSERTPTDSVVKFMLIEDCHNDYKLLVERTKEMKESAVDF